jgi:intracellular multiplication protein IcmT
VITSGILWRDTARPIRILFLDARSFACFGIWALHMCKETFYLSLVSLVVFFIIERFGLTPAAALRFLRIALFSKRRDRLSVYEIRRNCRC